MPYEIHVGLLVVNQAQYAQYRAEMTPILHEVGGSFRYDFEVARVLKAEVDHAINRVFVMHFPDATAKAQFFSNHRYQAVRQKFFEGAVERTAIIAEYTY